MTEDEAKTKWCPYSGTVIPIAGSHDLGCCIASACMMWRWIKTPDMAEYDRSSGIKMLENAMPIGFCGLAGRP